jgi:membrane associated rhomboid family serine protease
MQINTDGHDDKSSERVGADSSIWRGGDFATQTHRPSLVLTPLTCAAMVIVSLGIMLQGGVHSWEVAAHWGYLSPVKLLGGAYWGYITSVFVHQEPLHLVMNLYWMWILGRALERSVGPLRWLLFFVMAAWVSSGIQFLTGDPGIGMSGVGYALFGFGWRARERMSEFAKIITQKTVQLFLVWLVLCIVMTYTGIYAVGNGAHIGGMLFGMAVAEAFVCRRRVALMLVNLGALGLLATLPLFWCPWSVTWVSFQANKAMVKHDYSAAIGWYQRALQLGQEPAFVWANLAQIYGYQNLQAEYANALAQLRQVDAQRAEFVEARYGKPSTPSAP